MRQDLTKPRYSLVDAVRGFAVLNMVLYHMYFDLTVLFDFDIHINSNIRFVWQSFICLTFIVISGACLNFTSHAVRNGIVLTLLGALITVVTALLVPSAQVHFGILSFLGSAMLITKPLLPLLKRLSPIAVCSACAVLFVLLYGVSDGYVGIMRIRLAQLPDFLYSLPFLAYLGFPSRSFFSGDYFPIIPFIFAFIFGCCLWQIIRERGLEKYLCKKIPVFDFLGRHALLIYMLHQPVLAGTVFLLS